MSHILASTSSMIFVFLAASCRIWGTRFYSKKITQRYVSYLLSIPFTFTHSISTNKRVSPESDISPLALKNVPMENDGKGDACSKGESLVSRLRLDQAKDSDFVPLPGQLLRKYISYARTFVFPR